MAVTLEEVRALAMTLPRTTEAFVRGRVKFRVGRIVYLAFSRDETLMGFAFPKERARVARRHRAGEVPHAARSPTSATTGSSSGWPRSTRTEMREPGDRRLGDGRAEERLCALPGMSQWQSAVPESTTVPDVFTKLQL